MAPQEIRKSVLIIKSQPKSLAAVESFLKNRGWKILTSIDVKESLQIIVTQKPSFVMVSVDHPNRKVRALPKLLAQSLPVFVMAFSESNTTAAYKALLDSGAPYRINPPVTGPAVERTINKILRDQEMERERAAAAERAKQMAESLQAQAQERAHEQPHAHAHAPHEHNHALSGTIQVSGGRPGADSGADGVLSGQSGAHARGPAYMPDQVASVAPPLNFEQREALDRVDNLLNADGDGESDTAALLGALQSAARASGDEQPSGADAGESLMAAPLVTAGGPAHRGGAAYQPEAAPSDEAAPLMASEPAGFLSSDDPAGSAAPGRQKGAAYMPSGESLNPAFPHTKPRRSAADGGPAAEADPADEDDVILHRSPERAKASDEAEPLTASAPSAEKPMPRYSEEDFEGDAPEALAREGAGKRKAPDLSLLEPADLQREKKKRAMESDVIRTKGSPGWQKEENIIVRGAQRALDESVQVGDGQVRQKLEKETVPSGHSNVACLIVESARFSGYLVAALGKNRKMDEKFVETLKERLSKFLKDNGEPMQDEQSMALKIKPVDFEDWALEYADFLRKSVHEGEEIAMAFFPFSDAKTAVESSAQADMGAVKIDELQGDVNVDFNVYVYLPTNKKYVLYTPRGSKFYGSQKERLARMGVTHMHVKRTELQDVSKYRAQNYLNSKIQEFEKKKSGSRAS